ncbi:hypothetical protein ACFSUD_17585 [Sulfitobacter aestuarii]|uniref:Uncharacterized protein n=1 Tax=Sulfitobacter aestuarii TaxID=2161676 RepID=A0ABW5U7Y7_9RHOB
MTFDRTYLPLALAAAVVLFAPVSAGSARWVVHRHVFRQVPNVAEGRSLRLSLIDGGFLIGAIALLGATLVAF